MNNVSIAQVEYFTAYAAREKALAAFADAAHPDTDLAVMDALLDALAIADAAYTQAALRLAQAYIDSAA